MSQNNSEECLLDEPNGSCVPIYAFLQLKQKSPHRTNSGIRRKSVVPVKQSLMPSALLSVIVRENDGGLLCLPVDSEADMTAVLSVFYLFYTSSVLHG